MTKETNDSESYELENPHFLERNMKEAKANFWAFARSRTHVDTYEEHAKFHDAHFLKNIVPTSAAGVFERGSTEGDDPEKGILAMEISVNKDFFGEEYADLIPYAIEHEIYEMWVQAKRGLRVSGDKPHFLARMHQIEMAMKDGKAERLIQFYCSKMPRIKGEFEEAFNRVKNKKH